MSESSENKSKRNFINYLTNYVWVKQYSIFFTRHGDSLDIHRIMNPVRLSLKRSYPNIAMLYRNCIYNTPAELLEDIESGTRPTPYLTIFTSETLKHKAFVEAVDKSISVEYRWKDRPVKDYKLDTYIKTVKLEKPHNFKKHLGIENSNRFGIINKVNMVNKHDLPRFKKAP